MDHEIQVKVKNGWLNSRGHAKLYASAKYHCTNIHNDHFKKCDLWSINKLFLWFDLVTYFLIPSDPFSNLTYKSTNILSKIHDDCFKNVISKVLIKIFLCFDLVT